MNDTDDWFDIEQLGPATWRIGEAGLFTTYLLAGEDRAILLDGAVGVGDFRTVVEELVDVPVTVVLTHTHWDHMGAASQFDDLRVHERELTPDGEVRSDYVADEFNYELEDWLATWKVEGDGFPDNFDPDGYEIESSDAEAIGEETVDLGGRELEFVHLPGHAPGQLGALDRADDTLYGGDVVHLEHDLFIHFDGCDLREYVDTFERVVDLRDEGAFDTLFTAHNPPLSGDELSLLDEFHEGLQAILAGELSGEPNGEQPPGLVYDIAGNEVVTKPDVT